MIEKNCARCGKRFRSVTGRATLCSIACSKPQRQVPSGARACENCGQWLRVLDRPKVRFCDIGCKIAYDERGKGVTDEEFDIYRGKLIRRYRATALPEKPYKELFK